MKKVLLFTAVAAAALTSCSETETIEMPDSSAIRFGESFIGNPVRSQITTDNLTEFYVYGGSVETGGSATMFDNVFDNVKVTGSGHSWTYEGGDRYWFENKTYTFNAYAPALTGSATATPSANGLSFTNFTADGTTDLIAADVVEKSTKANPAETGKVNFTFKHKLTMVKFSFANRINESVKLNISDLKINGMNGTGNYILSSKNTGEWATSTPKAYPLTGINGIEYDENSDYSVKGESAEVILIPQKTNTDQVTVTFKVAAEYVTDEGQFMVKDKEVTVELDNQDLQEAQRYNFMAALTMEAIDPEHKDTKIEFDVTEVTPWVSSWNDVPTTPAPIQPEP